MNSPSRRVAAAAVMALMVTLVGGCSRTFGGPVGDLKLTARFADVDDLTVGHGVQISGVKVGSITGIRLDGYVAVVTMGIDAHKQVPVSAVAVVTRTSLLGELTIDLRVPDGVDPTAGPFLHSGDQIAHTEVASDFEQILDRADKLLGAIGTDAVSGLLNTAIDAIGNRGPQFNTMIAQLAHVTAATAAQRDDIAAAIDGLGKLTATLAPASGDFTMLVDQLVQASGLLATDRDRLIAAVDQIVTAATGLNDIVLEPHTERLVTMLQQLDPVLATLAASRGDLERLITAVRTAAESIPLLVDGDAAFAYFWFAGLVQADGTRIESPIPASLFDLAAPGSTP